MDALLANPTLTFVWIISLVLAITFHEAAHAFAADRLGDPTPRSQGRLSINPFNHIDLLGTILVPLLLLISTGGRFAFGWAKPVIFDPYNLKHPRKDAAIISLAGPGVNLAMAVLGSLIARFVLPPFYAPVMYPLVIVNVSLALFNLVPVHLAAEWQVLMRRYGTLILLLLIIPFNGISPLMTLIGPLIDGVLRLLLP